jgi:hypothetical protein
MTVKHTVDIGGVAPNYTFTFGGAASRMHKRGHIWLNADTGSVKLQLTLLTPNWVFENNGTTDGRPALFISDSANPAAKTQFRDYGVFSAPVLDTTGTRLTFTSDNTGSGVFYYSLRFRNVVTNALAVCDPIIHNT